MWICECGGENPDGTYFCKSCGNVRVLSTEILDKWEEELKKQEEKSLESVHIV